MTEIFIKGSHLCFLHPPILNGYEPFYKGGAFGKKYVPFSACFESLDHGVTWKPTSKGFSLNKEFKGRTDSFSAATDGEFVWVMWGDGDVWSGRWNGL